MTPDRLDRAVQAVADLVAKARDALSRRMAASGGGIDPAMLEREQHALHALAWAAVLLVPPPAPRWLLVALVVVIGTGGPGSMIGFDYARTFNPRSRQGAAVGIVNVGGFVASLLVAWAIGVVLGRAGGYTPEAFRIAWTVQYVVWAFAVVAVLGSRRLARRKLAAEGVEVLPLREVLAAWQGRRR